MSGETKDASFWTRPEFQANRAEFYAYVKGHAFRNEDDAHYRYLYEESVKKSKHRPAMTSEVVVAENKSAIFGGLVKG